MNSENINTATRNLKTREMEVDERAVQNFIKSHRARLEQEKENLGMTAVQSG